MKADRVKRLKRLKFNLLNTETNLMNIIEKTEMELNEQNNRAMGFKE